MKSKNRKNKVINNKFNTTIEAADTIKTIDGCMMHILTSQRMV